MNPAYNGTTNPQIFSSAQVLTNRTQGNQNYFTRIIISCRVSGILPGSTYLNNAVSTAEIGSAISGTLIAVTDSSNNGYNTAVDPNANGNANETGENVPTPFSLTILPVKFLGIQAHFTNENTSTVKWQVAVPVSNAKYFEVEFSQDGRRFFSQGSTAITNSRQASYEFEHSSVPAGTLFYRIKQADADGSYIYSSTVTLKRNIRDNNFIVYPNPADATLQVTLQNPLGGRRMLLLFDETGRLCLRQELSNTSNSIPVKNLADGHYLLQIVNQAECSTKKILIHHQ